MQKGPVINMRYESLAQVNRFKRAARVRRWSLNTFMVVAGERFAALIEEEVAVTKQNSTNGREQVMEQTGI